jgi:hypothetical protein
MERLTWYCTAHRNPDDAFTDRRLRVCPAVQHCAKFERGSSTIVGRCSRDETAALSQLRTEWTQFGRSDQTLCIGTTTTGGFASYVELLTCLEKAHDLVTANHDPDPDPHAKSATWPTQPGRPGITVGEGH